VGLELVTKSSYSYKALAMSLPAVPAKELISLLQAATNERFVA
jgi:hypothetical protein